MINISEVLDDPDFIKRLQLISVTGTFANEGEYTRVEDEGAGFYGAIQPAGEGSIVEFNIEGERLSEFKVLYVKPDVDIQWADGVSEDCDKVKEDDGTIWRAVGGRDFTDYGYKKILLRRTK